MPSGPKRIDAAAVASASASRISGKKVSDAFKKGNNAGMLFKKDMKSANDIHDVRNAQQKLRMKEASAKDSHLRQYTNL